MTNVIEKEISLRTLGVILSFKVKNFNAKKATKS